MLYWQLCCIKQALSFLYMYYSILLRSKGLPQTLNIPVHAESNLIERELSVFFPSHSMYLMLFLGGNYQKPSLSSGIRWESPVFIQRNHQTKKKSLKTMFEFLLHLLCRLCVLWVITQAVCPWSVNPARSEDCCTHHTLQCNGFNEGDERWMSHTQTRTNTPHC